MYVELEVHRRANPRFAGAYLGGEIFGYQVLFEFEFLSSATSRLYMCYTFRRARRRGDAFRRAVCRVRLNRVFVVVCVFVYVIMRSLFDVVQLIGPVLSTSISSKSGIISEFILSHKSEEKGRFLRLIPSRG